MSNPLEPEKIQAAGQIEITDLLLISFARGMHVSLIDYLIELNIYESIFSTTISGHITLADSRNLITTFPLQGEEYLYVNVKTPGLDNAYSITKTFKIHSITSTTYAKDGTTLIYQLSFTSPETFADVNNPLYRAFEGTPYSIINSIFIDYLQTDRNIKFTDTTPEIKNPLTFIDTDIAPSNKLKFVSPGWTPIQCINWVASKCLPLQGFAANYLFWETTKGFYFGAASSLIDNVENSFIGSYIYSQSYVQSLSAQEKELAMLTIKSLHIEKTIDNLENAITGYYSNRLLDIDLYNKQYTDKDYDHTEQFSKYPHLGINVDESASGTNSTATVPLYSADVQKTPTAHVQINYSVPKLHNTIENNFDQITKYVYGNRRSNIMELDNFKMEILIPGRTDIEAGNLIQINIPKNTGGPTTNAEKVIEKWDGLYSGLYLITSLSHKINPKTHYVSIVTAKDSFSKAHYDMAGQQK